MSTSRSDLLWGTGLLLVAGLLVVQLLLGDAGGSFQVATRVLRLVLVLSLAALLLTRHDLLALVVATAAVVLMLVTVTVGLVVAPEQFVGTGAKAPDDVAQARLRGALLAAAVVAGAGVVIWARWRSRSRAGGQAVEHGV